MCVSEISKVAVEHFNCSKFAIVQVFFSLSIKNGRIVFWTAVVFCVFLKHFGWFMHSVTLAGGFEAFMEEVGHQLAQP